MQNQVKSKDGVSIHYEVSGKGKTALVFVHGWIGNGSWWNSQRDVFSDQYKIVQIDLAGHGKSGRNRKKYSVESYAEDIVAVVEDLKLDQVVLVGHSMSGSNVLYAAKLLGPQRTKLIVFVDTLHDLDHMPGMTEMTPFFEQMKMNYVATVEAAFPMYMFAKTSPSDVVKRVVSEARAVEGELSINLLMPFYTTDIRSLCSEIKIPVKAINSDLFPTALENNRKYFPEFSAEIIKGVGHYPMLEASGEFNEGLERILKKRF